MRHVVVLCGLLLLLALLALGAWFFPLAKRPPTVANVTGDRIVIISPHWEGIRLEFARAFVPWYRDLRGRSIAIEWIDVGGTSDCVRYVRSEFKRNPGGIGIDLFFGGGVDPYLALKKEGRLVRVKFDSSLLALIPQNVSGQEVYDSAGFWYGAALSGFGIVFNKRVCRLMGFVPPRRWSDLADPRYATWVGAGDPRNSGTMHLMFEIILQGYGWNEGWRVLAGIAANVKGFTKNANDVGKMVSRGDVAFGLAIDFYGWAEVSAAGEDRVGFILPEDMTLISADGIAVLNGAPHRQAAEDFMRFVLSEPGQKLWYLRKGTHGGPATYELNRMPVRRDLYARYSAQSNVKQDPFASLNEFRFDATVAAARWQVVNDLAGVMLIDHAEALRVSIGSAGLDKKFQPPVSEAACLRLADSVWADPVKKNEELLRWHRWTQSTYKTVKTQRTAKAKDGEKK